MPNTGGAHRGQGLDCKFIQYLRPIVSSTTDLPVQDISSEVLIEKYAKGGEQTPDELRQR